MLRTDEVVDGMFVHSLELCQPSPASILRSTHLPRELLVRNMPLEHLPKDHRTRENINLMVVLRMRVPELGRLPVDGADQASNHRSCRLLDFSQAKVGDLRTTLGGDEDVGRFAVPVNDGGSTSVEVL